MLIDNTFFQNPAEADYFDLAGKIRPAELHFSLRDDVIYCSDEKAGIHFQICLQQQEERLNAVIPVISLREEKGNKLRTITLFPGYCCGKEGDGGALFLPLDSGRLCCTAGKKSGENWYSHFQEPESFEVSWSNMSILGCYAADKVRSLVIDGGKFDAKLRLRTNWGNEQLYLLDAVFFLRDYADDIPDNEDISVELYQCSGDYRALAQYYRQYVISKHHLPSLEQKSIDNPDLDYNSQALIVRCRMGVKPLPCTITEQTPETQPPVKVFMTFADIRRIATEFHRQGIAKVDFNLVGWNYGGHDGGFPQIFPVEEALGGEEELRKTIDYVKSLGYFISLHDNYFDGYTLAQNFSLSDAVVCHDGTLSHTSCGVLAGGQPYRICAQQAAEKYAVQNFPSCISLGVQGAHYIDVLSIIGMKKCYHGKHPLSRSGNARYYKRIMRMQQEFFNIAMSEGARDWALPELDRAYMVLNCIEINDEFLDHIVPFFELVYHGLLLFNNFREGINTFPGDKLYLQNLAWGGYPIIYFHCLFHPDWSAANGWSLDLTLTDDKKLAEDTRRIKKMYDDLQRLSPVRYSSILSIENVSDGVIKTEYSNGSVMWSNFTDHEIKNESGETLPPMDFVLN